MRIYAIQRELDPTNDQIFLLHRAVGAVRFAQNWALSHVKEALQREETVSWTAISLHTSWRQSRGEVAPWWGEESKETFQYGCERAAIALKNWSDSRKGKRKGKKVGFPRYRRRGKNDSAAYTHARLRACGTKVHVPRIGEIALKESALLAEGTRVLRTIVKPRAGRWFVVFRVQEDDWVAPEKRTGTPIGIDLGVGERFATLSTGEIVDNSRFYRTDERKLKKTSRVLARRKKGSNRRRKAAERLARLHYRIWCRRKDFLHKITTELVKSHDHLVIEDLAVKNMMRNRKVSKSFADVALSEFVRQLEYKSDWYGCRLEKADRFFASSKLCSTPGCGYKNTELHLSDRAWACPACGIEHDRDANAAVNLALSSGSSPAYARGAHVRPHASAAARDEARIFAQTLKVNVC